MEGWVKLHRKLLDSTIFQNPNLLKFWIWCLLKASHKSHMERVGLQELEILEGQFVFGRNKASAELDMTPSTVYKYLKVLEKEHLIVINSNNKFSVVTLVKWSDYQENDNNSNSKVTANVAPSVATKEQQSNNKVTTKEQQSNTNKNVKNEKNEKKDINTSSEYIPKFEIDSFEYKMSLCLVGCLKKEMPNAKVPSTREDMDKWCIHIKRMLEIDKRSQEEIQKALEFATTDSFWKPNIRSTSKFREKFETLYLQSKRKGAPVKATPKTNQFHNFDQRNYDFDELEQKLLNKTYGKSK